MHGLLLNTITILETDLEIGYSFNIPYGYERDAELLEMCEASSIKEFFIEAFLEFATRLVHLNSTFTGKYLTFLNTFDFFHLHGARNLCQNRIL